MRYTPKCKLEVLLASVTKTKKAHKYQKLNRRPENPKTKTNENIDCQYFIKIKMKVFIKFNKLKFLNQFFWKKNLKYKTLSLMPMSDSENHVRFGKVCWTNRNTRLFVWTDPCFQKIRRKYSNWFRRRNWWQFRKFFVKNIDVVRVSIKLQEKKRSIWEIEKLFALVYVFCFKLYKKKFSKSWKLS